jgi:uncharacterized membrane protein
MASRPVRAAEVTAAGIAAGSAATYFFDRAQGRRRRAKFRDKATHVAREARQEAGAVAQDARQRGEGLRHRLAHPIRSRRREGRSEGAQPAGGKPEYLQEVWSPSARALALAAGAGATLWGASRRGFAGAVAAIGGATLAARSVTNKPLRRLTGIGAGRSAVSVSKTITVDAPVDLVYAQWSAPSTFPLFMSNVLEVREGDDGLTHWKVQGPAGSTVEWDATYTAREPGELIAWETAPGSLVQHSGRVRFDTDGPDRTRVTVDLSYNPAAGAVGHGVATVLGKHPKRQLDEDLLRMKTYLETGQRPHDAAVPIPATPTAPT